MYRVELYARVRRACHVEGMSTREASRVFGVDRKTVRKMLSFSVPPGYRRSAPPRRPKLGPFTGIIDRILEDDRTSHRKQRHTAKRIFDRLRDEYGFTGGYTIVKDYVREQGLRSREVFVPLSHSPGHAQADFGEAMAVIGGALRKIHFLAFDLPHSDGCFVAAYPAETTEAFCDGHNAAFAFFGGVPRSILYDNTKLAVARILGDGKRQRTRVFTELQSHYLFEDMALDWVELGRFAKSRNVLVILAFTPAVVRVCYLGDVSVLELASRPVDHDAQLARIDEQNLARPVAETTVLPVLRQEPQTGGDLGGIEQLPRQGDHAVDHAALDHRAVPARTEDRRFDR